MIVMDINTAKKMRSGINLRATITSKENPRSVNYKTGGTGEVCTAVISDDTGEIKLTLWNDEIDKVEVGDTVEIANGYTSEFKGEVQLNIGKYGNMTVEKSTS